jgi:hypothetical protein
MSPLVKQAWYNYAMAVPNRIPPIEQVDDDLVAVFKPKSPAESVAMMGEANETARILAAAGVRHLHPGWAEDQVRAEVARRMLGDSA